jgi:PAS domain S-box-containing protein
MEEPDETLGILAVLGLNDVSSVQQFAELKSYLENLIEHANALVIGVDRSQRVTVWNAAVAGLTGVERRSALGRPLSGFVAAEQATPLGTLLARTLGGEAVDGFDLRLARGGGGEARVAFNTAPVRDVAGRIDGVVAIGQDQTRLRHLEAAAEQAEKMAGLGRLAAGIVHELNNPLVAVTMYADSLYTKWSAGHGDPGDLEKIAGIREAGQRIQKLTRDLAAYARPGAGKEEPLELAPLLDQAALICKPALKEADAKVQRDFQAVPLVTGSWPSLTQVFVNLITNAAQAIKKGGTVRLELRFSEGRVQVTVADDGAGMTPEIQGHLFEPFFTARPGRGIGLGLATVKGIVERHGATIAVETAPGKGTRVTVALRPILLARAGGPPDAQVSGVKTA